MSKEFYGRYFKYIGDTEAPRLYHRWTAVSIVAALLGRQFYLPFGHAEVFPNFYILLVGDPGTRKNSAIMPGKKLLRISGYTKFSPDRVSPERFIAELERSATRPDTEYADILDLEKLNIDEPCEIYACIGEFGDFIGSGNFDFIKLLTNLWDNLPEYSHPKLHGKSVYVNKPTINILGGITSQSISKDIPVEAIGQGAMSRFILVACESTGHKITFPKQVPDDVVKEFADYIKQIKETVHGPAHISPDAAHILDRMYREFVDIDDYRFRHYSTRRFTYLLKLCMVFAAMGCSTTVEAHHCIEANTLLFFTERKMSKALGEFGKAKNADVANNVMSLIRASKVPLTVRDIWKHVAQDLTKMSELVDIITNLRSANKVQVVEVNKRQGFLPLNEFKDSWAKELLDDNFLTIEEKL